VYIARWAAGERLEHSQSAGGEPNPVLECHSVFERNLETTNPFDFRPGELDLRSQLLGGPAAEGWEVALH
jgi:hypothetical protein